METPPHKADLIECISLFGPHNPTAMKYILSLLMAIVLTTINAQDYSGFVNSNYSGITGAQLNPASIVDNRLIVDVNLIGLSVNAANNYLGMRRSALDHNGSFLSAVKKAAKGDENAFPAFKDSLFQYNYLVDVNNGKDKSVFSSVRISLPSFMFSLGPSNAIGVSVNARTYVNLDGVSEELARLMYSDIGRTPPYNVNDLLGKSLTNKYLSANAMMWMEYGLTFAHVFKSDNEHFFKAGVTPKLLQGLASGYANVRDLQFRFDNDPVRVKNDSVQFLAVFKTEVNYGHSDNLEVPSASAPDKGKNPAVDDPTLLNTLSGYPKFASYPGFGLDLGVIYEYRPGLDRYKYNMDGKTGLWRKDKNKYKVKVGFSVLDIGSIKFRKGPFSQDFRIDIDSIQYRIITTDQYPVYDMDKIIDSLSERIKTENTYKMALPTAISAQIDYNIWKDFYINLTPFIGLQQKNRQAKVHDITVISLTPRWDHKWFGFSVPVSYNSFYAKARQPIKIGTMVRLGPLILGTSDLSAFYSPEIFGMNFYFLLKVPIPYVHPKDKDKDGISNRYDLCREVPGVWEFKGCPDRDGDHVQDSGDRCPDIPGLKELQGCPDRDGDGITDDEDMCPDSAGTTQFKGCPDRDGDGIIDRTDECPDVAGLSEFQGCPDTDGDGTQDKEDLCVDIFGPKEYKGCPDKDGDRILDKDDECPEISGPAENKGCPWPDTDKDGIIDREDSCVTVVGIVQYKGCPPPPPPPPPMKPAEKKIIERAFASLEFATAKDIIKPKSFPSLNELAKLLIAHRADWKLKLSGHTDNEGTPEKNMELSEKRANAVKNYLVKKGVDPEQIITEWFGQTMPIADNKTAKGRQKNRRVEMKILAKE
jgi:outer membrane protein OmpA-like peptidoglycan-associated protein